VQSRAASFRYRGMSADIKQVARELNVRYVVQGSIRRMGEHIRISVQLIDGETGNHVWAERFDREQADFFVVQDQVVRTIVSTLVGRVEVAAVERMSRKSPTSLAAFECVLKGNALAWQVDSCGPSSGSAILCQKNHSRTQPTLRVWPSACIWRGYRNEEPTPQSREMPKDPRLSCLVPAFDE
jgi:hypothetical protein